MARSQQQQQSGPSVGSMALLALALLVGEQQQFATAWQGPNVGGRFLRVSSFAGRQSQQQQQQQQPAVAQSGFNPLKWGVFSRRAVARQSAIEDGVVLSNSNSHKEQQRQQSQAAAKQAWRSPSMDCDPGVQLGDMAMDIDERDACGVGFVAQPGRTTHDVVTRALNALGCMEHRGACAADQVSGDGSGVLTEIPWQIISDDVPEVAAEMAKQTTVSKNNVAKRLASKALLGVGMIFLDRDPEVAAKIKDLVADAAKDSGFRVVAWRPVPVDESILGEASADTVPTIEQVVVAPIDEVSSSDSGAGALSFDDLVRDATEAASDEEGAYVPLNSGALERGLYLLRRRLRGYADEKGYDADSLYVASFSSRTMTYKGMVNSNSLGLFYHDLLDERFKASFCIYHRRFSTNTMPKWPLAQPMRMLGHNGEINTLLGNVNWMRARAGAQTRCDIPAMKYTGGEDATGMAEGTEDELLDSFMKCDTSFAVELGPLVDTSKSDSANLDSILELYNRAGKPPQEAISILVPPAWENGRISEADAAAFKGEAAAAETKDLLAFHKFHAPLQEPWDGPALIVFADGLTVGATLDRNGLRPARYTRLNDGTVYVMSETGVVPIEDEAVVVEKGRLGPGQMISIDLVTGTFSDDAAIKKGLAKQQDWQARLDETQVPLPKSAFPARESTSSEEALVEQQVAFGWGSEDVSISIADMAAKGMEATYSMGDDAPLSVLSEYPHVPYNYFRQRFAQVTNPPIDPLREGEVMSLAMALGRRGHVLNEQSDDSATKVVTVDSPVLAEQEMAKLRDPEAMKGLKTATLSTLYEKSSERGALKATVADICAKAVELVESGAADVLVLSDMDGVSEGTLYVPPLVAVGAVHHELISRGLRMRTSLVVESGQVWTTHHLAVLVGYGASAVHPYLAFETVRQWATSTKTAKAMQQGRLPPGLTEDLALNNFRQGLEKGLLKILSKMGISRLSSYHGAQIFEALGVGGDLLDISFKGTPSRIGGLDMADMEKELVTMHARAFAKTEKALALPDEGHIKPKPKMEHHSNSAALAKVLHDAVRNKDAESFRKWSNDLANRPVTALRDLLELVPAEASGREPVSVDEVEPIEAIMGRFVTGGMSLGALSRECHETIAVALNRINGKSNCGEGGEDRVRQKPSMPLAKGDTYDFVDEKEADEVAKFDEEENPAKLAATELIRRRTRMKSAKGMSKTLPHLTNGGLKDGDDAGSKIKQVSSGRFGVTPEYLATADQLEIKVAQGAKPGEGGQLPGPKVSEYIAFVRGSKAGVTLISPPPHHDIYSIEDLAQLIFDLKTINPTAPVCVKLVAEPGIGTVAAGVVKANADVVQVSGHDGGTGASPLTSLKHAGSSWELGAAEAQRTLVENGLRQRCTMRVDGGIRTGHDVVMAALLGGEEFGFGTTAMIAAGCVMARVCHLNSCPVGVTTQRPELREKFPGVPEDVVNYFAFVAEEVRWYLAALGCKSLDEVVGAGATLLRPRSFGEENNNPEAPTKTDKITTTFLTDLPTVGRDGVEFAAPDAATLKAKEATPNVLACNAGALCTDASMHFDEALMAMNDAAVAGAVVDGLSGSKAKKGEAVVATAMVVNTDRSVGTLISGEVARAHGDEGIPLTEVSTEPVAARMARGTAPEAIKLDLTGSAGQSMGAFLIDGVEIELKGEANDYVGKGIHGGRIVIKPKAELEAKEAAGDWAAEKNVICGNTCLYGATGGAFHARGRAGERFAVRNSGCHAVVEGTGDHCCEYMTNGVVVALGDTGRNIGAGMTGGLAYFYMDEETGDEEFDASLLKTKMNMGSVSVRRVASKGGEAQLKSLISDHAALTGSVKAQALLDDWDASLKRFWQVIPASEEQNSAVVDGEAEEEGAEVGAPSLVAK